MESAPFYERLSRLHVAIALFWHSTASSLPRNVGDIEAVAQAKHAC